MDYWKVLLKKQRERGRSGFTLPFLIGSQRYLSFIADRQGIKTLIFDMVSNDSFETCARYCMDTNELIFEIRKPTITVVYPLLENNPQSNFSVSIGNDNLGKDIESVVYSLVERYQALIDQQLFSVRNRQERDSAWGSYTEEEEIFIKQCFRLD